MAEMFNINWPFLAEALPKIILAAIVGGIIGWEREIHEKPAGLRTIIMICVGSTLIMIVSIYVAENFSPKGLADPARIAAQVVTGIGFLGAGSIIKARGNVVGLTTAAGIWAVSGIGLAIGAGLFGIALFTTAIIIVTLWIFHWIERAVFHEFYDIRIKARLPGEDKELEGFQDVIDRLALKRVAWKMEKTEGGAYLIELTSRIDAKRKDDVLSKLQRRDCIFEIEMLEPPD